MEPLHIYGDFGAARESPRNPARSALPLDKFGSLKDLSNAGIRLRNILRVSIYMDSDDTEDLMATADVYFDSASRRWYAEFDVAGIRDVPRHDVSSSRFRCVQCHTDLPMGDFGRPSVDACPACHTSVLAAIEAPDEPA